MGDEPTRVAIVVVPDFADGLLELAKRRHVWIAETPPNRAAAERVSGLVGSARSKGVTTFTVGPGVSLETVVVELLPVVDEHHGLRSEWASDVDLEVRGAECAPLIRAALAALGPFEFEGLPDGFVARRRVVV